MDLLKSYFRQTAALVSDAATGVRISSKDFGNLEFEKYYSLLQGGSAKRTWFFRMDFLIGNRTVRYLFFFGGPSYLLRSYCDVVLHVAREEERPYYYHRLEQITASNVPSLFEIGYKASEESFFANYRGAVRKEGVEQICRQFIEEVVSIHS